VGDNSRKEFWRLVDQVLEAQKKCYEPCIYRQQISASRSAPQSYLNKSKQVADIGRHISAVSRYSNANYVNAIDRRKTDELAWRVDRVLRKLRPQYSATGYGELAAGVAVMNEQELRGWLTKVEARLNLRW